MFKESVASDIAVGRLVALEICKEVGTTKPSVLEPTCIRLTSKYVPMITLGAAFVVAYATSIFLSDDITSKVYVEARLDVMVTGELKELFCILYLIVFSEVVDVSTQTIIKNVGVATILGLTPVLLISWSLLIKVSVTKSLIVQRTPPLESSHTVPRIDVCVIAESQFI